MPPVRPEGWGEQYVLSRLEAGEKVTHVCARAVKGLPVKWETLYQEIRAWRKQSQEFDEQYQFWLDHNAKKHPGRGQKKNRVGRGSSLPAGWHHLWLRTYVHCRCNAVETIEMMREIYGVDVSMSTINAMRNSSHALYNEDFSRQFEEARPLRVEMNAGVIHDIVDDPNVDARTRATVALQVNERLDKVNWGRSTHMIHSGQVDHRLQIEHDVTRLKELVADRFSEQRRLKPRPIELEVVEVEAVEIEA